MTLFEGHWDVRYHKYGSHFRYRNIK